MENQTLAADSIVSRSREISEERWVEIKGELEDAKGRPLTTDSCPPSSFSEERRPEPAPPASKP